MFRILLHSILGQKWRRGFLRRVGVGKLAMQEGMGRRRGNIEDRVQDGVRRVRSISLGELKSTTTNSLGEFKSSSSETFSAARRLVLDSVLGRVSNSQAAVVRRKAVRQVS